MSKTDKSRSSNTNVFLRDSELMLKLSAERNESGRLLGGKKWEEGCRRTSFKQVL